MSSKPTTKQLIEQFEKQVNDSDNAQVLRFACRKMMNEINNVVVNGDFCNSNSNTDHASLILRERKSILRKCLISEKHAVVDESSRRCAELVMVKSCCMSKPVILAELLAALEAQAENESRARLLVRGIYEVSLLKDGDNNNEDMNDDDEQYMPLFRALKSGGGAEASMASTVLCYATKDIKVFEKLFYRTILERNFESSSNGSYNRINNNNNNARKVSSSSSRTCSGIARSALFREGSLRALEILTKCLPWYRAQNSLDFAFVCEAIADIADFLEERSQNNTTDDEETKMTVDAITVRAEFGARAILNDAIQRGLDLVEIARHTHRIIRLSSRTVKNKHRNALAACDLLTNSVEKLSIEDQSSLLALCNSGFPDILRIHLLKISCTLPSHLGGDLAYSMAVKSQARTTNDDEQNNHCRTSSYFPLSVEGVLYNLIKDLEFNDKIDLETKQKILEHHLMANDDNDDLFALALMHSPLSIRVRKAALASVMEIFRTNTEFAISGLPVVSIALANLERNISSTVADDDLAIATLMGLKATASAASHPLSQRAALRALLPIVEYIDTYNTKNGYDGEEERSLALDLILLAEAWISAPSLGSQLSFRFQQAIESAIASSKFEETVAGATAMLNVSIADPFRAAAAFANAIQTCIDSRRPGCCRAIGLETIEVLCEADALEFYPALKIITKYMPTRPKDSRLLAKRWLRILKLGVADADIFPEAGSLVINALLDCIFEKGTPSVDACIKIEAWKCLDEYDIKQIKNLLNVYDDDNDDVGTTSTSANTFSRLVDTFIDEEDGAIVRAAATTISRIVQLESESISRLTRTMQKQINLIGEGSLNEDPFFYRLTIACVKKLRKTVKKKEDEELLSPLVSLLLFEGKNWKIAFRDFARKNKFSHAVFWTEYVIENTMWQFFDRARNNYKENDAENDFGNMTTSDEFFSLVTNECQTPDAAKTARIANIIAQSLFKSDATDQSEVHDLVNKCARLGCPLLASSSEKSTNIFRTDDFNEIPEKTLLELASSMEALHDEDTSFLYLSKSVRYLKERENNDSWLAAIIFAIPIFARCSSNKNNKEFNTLMIETVKALLVIALTDDEQSSSLASLGALTSLCLERGIPLENALCEKIVNVLISAAANDSKRQLSSEDRCFAICGASAILAGDSSSSSSSWFWLPSKEKKKKNGSSAAQLFDVSEDEKYFLAPLILTGRGQDLAKRLLKTLENLSISSSSSRVSDCASLALGFASISARTLILLSATRGCDGTKQIKNVVVVGLTCTQKLLDVLFTIDSRSRAKANALEAFAKLELACPLPNGDGPWQSLLRRCFIDILLVPSVINFAVSRPAKHIGGEILKTRVLTHERPAIINNTLLLRAIQASTTSEDPELFHHSIIFFDSYSEDETKSAAMMKSFWLGTFNLNITAATPFLEKIIIELLRRTKLTDAYLKYATEGLKNIAMKLLVSDKGEYFATILRQGCETDLLQILTSRLILLGVDLRPDDMVPALIHWNVKRASLQRLLHLALDVQKEEDILYKQKTVGAKRIMIISEFKKRLIKDACDFMKQASATDGDSACSCLMLLLLRFGTLTNRGFIYSQIIKDDGKNAIAYFPFAISSALIRRGNKKKSNLILFDASMIFESLLQFCLKSRVKLNPTVSAAAARALRELYCKSDDAAIGTMMTSKNMSELALKYSFA